MRSTYKQVIVDRYEVHDIKTGMVDLKTKVLDIDTYDIDINEYDPEKAFTNWFGPFDFGEGFNHVITVELYNPDGDESVDDPVATWEFKWPAH